MIILCRFETQQHLGLEVYSEVSSCVKYFSSKWLY